MAWVAKIEGVEKKIQRSLVPQEAGATPVVTQTLRYEFTVRFYDKDNPAKFYVRKKLVDTSVTKNQVLNAIKTEIAELNTVDTFEARVSPFLNSEIDDTTIW
jgi:hypothetical protein